MHTHTYMYMLILVMPHVVIIPQLLVFPPLQNSPPKATGRSPLWEGIKKFTQTMQKDSLTLSLLWFVFVFDHVWMTMLAWIFFWWLYVHVLSRCLPMCTSSSNRSVPMQDRQWMLYWYSLCCDGVCALFSWQIGSLGRELVQLQQQKPSIPGTATAIPGTG